MGSDKRAVKFKIELLKKLIQEKGSINAAAKIAGYSHATTFRAVLRKGEIAPEKLIALAEYLGITADHLAADETDEDWLLAQHLATRGAVSFEDQRERADISPIEYDLLMVARDLGFGVVPLADGFADYIGKEYSGKIDYSKIQKILQKSAANMDEEFEKLEKGLMSKGIEIGGNHGKKED